MIKYKEKKLEYAFTIELSMVSGANIRIFMVATGNHFGWNWQYVNISVNEIECHVFLSISQEA